MGYYQDFFLFLGWGQVGRQDFAESLFQVSGSFEEVGITFAVALLEQV